MNCTYCGTQNGDGDHRCRRCGRRLHFETIHAEPAAAVAPLRTSTAPRLDQCQRIPAEVTAAVREQATRLPPRQKTLFPERVLRFEDFAPPAEKASGKPPRPRRRPRVSRRLRKLEEAGQQRLQFAAEAPPAGRPMKSGVRSARSSRLPVATAYQRFTAAAIDALLVLAALAAMALTVGAVGGPDLVRNIPPLVCGTAAVAVFFLYNSLWWLARAETPGMAWRRLRLFTFTDQRPTRAQLAQRRVWALLSVAAAGLGILWMLADEERLGWHDYLSQTFPSPAPPER